MTKSNLALIIAVLIMIGWSVYNWYNPKVEYRNVQVSGNNGEITEKVKYVKVYLKENYNKL